MIFSTAIRCHECGTLTNGNEVMSIDGYNACPFVSTADNVVDATGNMKECPEEDTCCFALRESMTVDFWGRKLFVASLMYIGAIRFFTVKFQTLPLLRYSSTDAAHLLTRLSAETRDKQKGNITLKLLSPPMRILGH